MSSSADFHWLLSHSYSSYEEAAAMNPLRNGRDNFMVPTEPFNSRPRLLEGPGPRPGDAYAVTTFLIVKEQGMYRWVQHP